jgi:UDP-N-acetylmuramoyl-tripeptide--D-alanyl-D-alanine ligase
LVLANSDLCDAKYLSAAGTLLTYAIDSEADFKPSEITGSSESKAEQYSRLAAAAVARKLGMAEADIKIGIKNINPVPGRMQRLKGVNDSVIIDDSYNSSPEAAKLALDSLYQLKAPQKIALLGSMNELGEYSQTAHEEVGSYCDPKQLELVVTLGPEANEFLAKAAEAKGCQVRKFDSPYQAGDFIRQAIKPGAVILIKGSQNQVFAEEAIKVLLADTADQSKLVRQSKDWMDIKRKSFGR